MGLRGALVAVACGVALTACGDDASTSTTTVAPSTSVATSTTAVVTTRPATTTTTIPPPVVESVIDLGGTQLLGMTVTNDAVWAVSYDAGTISRVDPATNAVTSSYEVPGAASTLAVNGVVWVASYGGPRSLVAIDSSTGDLRASVEAGELCCDLTSDGTDVWAIDPAGRLLQVGDGGVDRATPIDIDARNAHTNVVYAGGSLWVSSDTTPLHRIASGTDEATDVDVGGGVPFLEHDGMVWGASPIEIWAVDPATSQVAERIALEGSTEVLSLNFDDDGDIWVGIRRARRVGAVLQLDRASGEVMTELRDVDIPARIEFGFGSMWITDSGSSSLYRVAA